MDVQFSHAPVPETAEGGGVILWVVCLTVLPIVQLKVKFFYMRMN